MTEREELRRKGETVRAGLFAGQAGAGGTEAIPGFHDLLAEVTYAGVWSRPGLGRADRMICTLAALAAKERPMPLRRHIVAALDMGLEARTIGEILLQCGLYAGFAGAEETMAIAGEVFAARGIVLEDTPETDTVADLSERGDRLLQELHGKRGRQGYATPGDPVTGALYPAAIAWGYGAIWFRPGLDRRQRALVAVAAFTALHLTDQLAKFGQSALNVGASRAEVIEAVVQTAPYSGFPPALNALAALSAVWRTPASEVRSE